MAKTLVIPASDRPSYGVEYDPDKKDSQGRHGVFHVYKGAGGSPDQRVWVPFAENQKGPAYGIIWDPAKKDSDNRTGVFHVYKGAGGSPDQRVWVPDAPPAPPAPPPAAPAPMPAADTQPQPVDTSSADPIPAGRPASSSPQDSRYEDVMNRLATSGVSQQPAQPEEHPEGTAPPPPAEAPRTSPEPEAPEEHPESTTPPPPASDPAPSTSPTGGDGPSSGEGSSPPASGGGGEGAAPPPQPGTSPQAPVGGGSVHTVVRGDTMWDIAQANGMSLAELVALNPHIENPRLIYPGDKINLSSGGASYPRASSYKNQTGQAPAGATHTVVPGDTMWDIAQANGMSLAELVELNPQIENPRVIRPGQKINIGAKGASASAGWADGGGTSPDPAQVPLSGTTPPIDPFDGSTKQS